MDGVFAALEGLPFVEAIRFSRWGYAAVNAAHILGLALVVGSTVPLNLRLLGIAWKSVDRADVVRVLSATAASGLALAVCAGLILFATRATEYGGSDVLWVKLALVACGTTSAVIAHVRYGWTLTYAPRGACTVHAVISLTCWVGALICGRLIAFTLP
ncbi:MAG: hypothetical protein RIC16_00480 [Rhodospirillales bacterium]